MHEVQDNPNKVTQRRPQATSIMSTGDYLRMGHLLTVREAVLHQDCVAVDFLAVVVVDFPEIVAEAILHHCALE